MVEWHRRTNASIALRFSGFALVAGGWFLGLHLTGMIQSVPREATPAKLLLGMVIFACLSASMALAIVGPGLFERITISARWASQIHPARKSDDPATLSDRP